MERVLRLLEIIYASAVAHEIQNLRRDICCGCKIYAQDCLMMTEEEGWSMHGLVAMERVNSSPSVWHEFLNVLGVLNMDVRKEFADHLMGLQKDPDRYFVEALLQVYENNRAMMDILHNLSHPPAQPLEPYSIAYFSNPGSYKYYVKGSDETFQSYESDHQKAYRKHMKNKLHEHLNKLI